MAKKADNNNFLDTIIKEEYLDSYKPLQTDLHDYVFKKEIKIENVYEDYDIIIDELEIGPVTIQSNLSNTEIQNNVGNKLKCATKTKNVANTCDTCGQSFANAGNLSRHVKILHSGVKPYSCKECDAKFKHKEPLDTHMKRYHSKSDKLRNKKKRFTCKKCYKSYINKNSLIKHLVEKPCSHDDVCKFCSKKFAENHSLRQHEYYACVFNPNKRFRSFVCNYCNKSYTRKDSLEEHITYIHLLTKSLHECNICDKKYTRKFNLKKHMLSRHLREKRAKNKKSRKTQTNDKEE